MVHNKVERLEISQIEIASLDPRDYEVSNLGDFYLTRIIKKANELGLSGKKIKEIVRIDETFGLGKMYVDLVCE